MNITNLNMTETVRLNSDPLANLFVELGETGAQNVVCRAMEELTIRLAVVEQASLSGNTVVIGKSARALIGIAEQIGMVGLADVARDVHYCAVGADKTALAATVSRLLRTGENSLTKVWSLQNLSG